MTPRRAGIAAGALIEGPNHGIFEGNVEICVGGKDEQLKG